MIDNNDFSIPSEPVPSSTGTRKLIGAALVIIALIASFRLGYVSGNKGFVFDPKSFKVINQNEAPAEE